MPFDTPTWNDDRRMLYERLARLDAKFAGMYRRVIGLLDDETESEDELARASLVGHGMREIMNRLPDLLRDVPGTLRPSKPSTRDIEKQLVAELESAGELPDNGVQVSLPIWLVRTVSSLGRAIVNDGARASEQKSIAVTQTRRSADVAVGRWSDAHEYFFKYVHIGSFVGPESARHQNPNFDEILSNIELVEMILQSRLEGYFDRRASLDVELEVINRLDNGSVS